MVNKRLGAVTGQEKEEGGARNGVSGRDHEKKGDGHEVGWTLSTWPEEACTDTQGDRASV